MPWLSVNQTLLTRLSAVPTPTLALEVHLPGIPGHPGACVAASTMGLLSRVIAGAPFDLQASRRSFPPVHDGGSLAGKDSAPASSTRSSSSRLCRSRPRLLE